MVTFCSIAQRATFPNVRVLASTLRREHPDARIIVLLVGGVAADGEEAFETLRAEEVVGHGVDATADLLRPHLLRRALDDGAEVAAYLDPQVCVYGSVEPALAQARERGVVLVRRLMALPEDGLRPDHSDLLVAGVISQAFVAVSRRGDCERFLEWWSQRVARPGESGARWLDLAGEMFASVVSLEDPGCNVSYWNLHERPLERRGGRLLAAGQPLRFLDFAGFRPDRPYLLSDAATRVSVIDDPVLAELCGEYAERVRAAGWTALPTRLETAERLGNGLPMNDLARTLWAEAAANGHEFGDPSSPLAAEAFASWLREPAELGAGAGVNRYVYAAFKRRPDLQRVFPDLDGADGPSLIAWAWEHGREELELIPELLPAAGDGPGGAFESEFAVNVIGYLRDTLGLAQAARLYVKTLGAAGVALSTTAIAPDLPVGPGAGKAITRHGRHAFSDLQSTAEPAFNLVCINGDHLAALIRTVGEEILAGRPTIGQWAWETDVIPPSWLAGFRYVDEIWVNSRFVAENIGRVSPVPVVVVPQAIVVPDDIDGVEVELVRDDRFTFLFMLDFFSTVRRKNADGLVEAFKRAFAPDEGPRLLVKTINASFRRHDFDELRWRIGDRPDIELIDQFLEPPKVTALLARADCYVSVHRSEGFGLTLAESMALGTPVIATSYSGNMDFTTPQNSYLVDWAPTRVGPDCDVYPPEGSWAEPNLDHAAELMRRVWQRPEEARAKAARARADIERLYAPAVAGRIARARLERLREERAGMSRSRDSSAALAAVERQLAVDVRRGPSARGGVVGLARRAVLRLMLPFTFHERNLDRALADAVSELRTDLERERSAAARLRARLLRIETALARRDGER